MSKNVPTSVPKTVPTAVPTWKPHWKNYHDPRPTKHRGMIAWSVTKPMELQTSNNKDKRLSSGTSDKRVAENVKWEKAAIIYQWFDEELEKLRPQVTPEENWAKFIDLALKQWKKYGHPTETFFDSFAPTERPDGGLDILPEMDDVIRLLNQMDIEVTDDMLSLLDDEAKHWLTNHPALRSVSKEELKDLERYGTKDVDALLEEASTYLAKLSDPDPVVVAMAKTAIQNITMRPEIRTQLLTDKDKELAEAIESESGKYSSTISAVGKRYLKERKWNRERTRSGVRKAIERFCTVIGGNTDIEEINAKHAYSFAAWMEQELDAANRSIKTSCSYVKGMFAWAITQQDYEITRLPWDKLDKITEYGVPSKGYKPFTIEQLHEIFSLAEIDGIGKMNPREHLLLAILITTGCRMDEAALLCWDNIIKHDKGFHYIDLTKALVKNMGSKRLLPIPDVLLNIMPQSGHQVTVDGIRNSPDGRLFDYALDTDGKSSRAASQACKRQLEKIKRDKMQVTHSFRGNLKDMLRDAGVSKELNNYITGHAQGDVGGDRYGKGHSVELRYEALNKPSHLYIQPYES